MTRQARVATKLQDLQARWQRLSQLLEALQQQKDLETRADEKIRLDHAIAERESEQQQVEAQLQQLEEEQQSLADASQASSTPSSSRPEPTPVSPAPGSQRPIEVFYSYAHEDEALCKKLDTHLSILKNQGIISSWYDREIQAGAEWEQAIDSHIESADIILLLVSADFIASPYCWGKELKRALERHQAGSARVIPILLREVDWTGAPFSKLQMAPKDAKPVTSWSNMDEAFTDVARSIRRVVTTLKR